MKEIGNPSLIYWAFRLNPQNQDDLLAFPGESTGSLCVVLCTQQEFAEDFIRERPEEEGAFLGPVVVEDLPEILQQRAADGCTHVVVDPPPGVGNLPMQHSLTIRDFIQALT